MADENERLKLWLNFWRVIIVSGVLGTIAVLVPPWINAQIQDKQLEIDKNQKNAELEMAQSENEAEIRAKRLELEQNYVTTFLERATEENVENRFRFTRYLSALTLDKDLKAGWKILFTDAEQERSAKQQRLEALRGQTDEEAKAEIARLQKELEATKRRRDHVSMVPTSLAKIQENAPCPENSEPIVSAIESDWSHFGVKAYFVKSGVLNVDPGQWNSPPSESKWFSFPFSARVFNIIRLCVTEDRKLVGDVVRFGPTGDVLNRFPTDLLAELGISLPPFQ